MTPDQAEKASERAERLLIEGILDGSYPSGSMLPGERDLCKELGVARPALREALQRLSRDGWLEIQQGKPTLVNDFLRKGNLNVLIGLLKSDINLLPGFILDLLEMWSLMAPFYTRAAIERDPKGVYQQLYGYRGLADQPRPYVRAQWRLHRKLADLCGNSVFGLILNSFSEIYRRLALAYYADPAKRAEANAFWEALHGAALTGDDEKGAEVMWEYMQGIYANWPTLDLATLIQDEPNEDETQEEVSP